MAKKDTVAAIKAANSVELNPDNYKQAELDQLLALAEKGEAGQVDFDTLKKKFDDDGETPDDNEGEGVAKEESKIKVRVNYSDRVAADAGFIHPVSKQLITGPDPVSVPADEWTDTMIRDKTLTEVR